MGVDPFKRGVMVFQVRRGSPADKIGLRPGDFVKKINSTDINLVRDLETVFSSPSPAWDVTIVRQGRELTERFEG